MTERARLTDALALAARPHEREYAIHDTALQGFILRVQPNGARSWVFRYRRDGKPRRVTLGKPDSVKADQARAAALAFLAREMGGRSPVPLPASGPTLTKFAAEYVKRRSPSWKPSTVKATLSYLNSAILPALGHLRVGAVVRADIARFFHEYGRRKPGGANRSHEILRNMFDCAISWGHRPEAAGNPCKGIVRYRRPPRGRLLGADDLAKLGAVPAPARRRTTGLRRGGAPAPVDRMQAGRDTLPALVRGQAGSLDPERREDRAEARSARRGGAGAAGRPRRNGVRGMGVSGRQGKRAVEYG